MSRIKQYRPTPAMVVALVALVFAMSGWAAAQIPNPLPLQDSARTPVTVVRKATGSGITTVQCGPNERLTGGGASAAPVASNWRLATSSPIGPDGNASSDGGTPTGWMGIVVNAVGTIIAADVYAVCETP